MTKITADHLGRGAFVYIRQSTADQLLHNLESRRRQYGLADRARQLGWTTVEVIDDDLGRSGGGINRPGFERLLAVARRMPYGGGGAQHRLEAAALHSAPPCRHNPHTACGRNDHSAEAPPKAVLRAAPLL
jgi:resolvase-like protein